MGAGGPGEGVAVGGAGVGARVEVKFFGARDDGRVEPGDGGEFVPHVFLVGVFGDVLSGGRVGLGDLGDHLFGEASFDGDVDGRVCDFGPGRMENGVSGFGVHPEIEFAAGIEAEFGIGGLRIDAAAHDDELLGEFGEVRVDCDGEREIGERASGVDGDLMRVEMNHADHEVRCVFGGGCGVRRAFDERGNFEGAVEFFAASSPVPSALVDDFAVERFPVRDELRGIVEREDGAGDDGNVGASDDFEHAESVGDFFVAPAVSGDDGDAEDLGLRGLDEGEDGLLVGGGGAAGVLVNDDFARGLGGGGKGEEKK